SEPSVVERDANASEKLWTKLAERQKSVGVGRYIEPRTCYQGEQFRDADESESEPRTIHMGIDLFVPPGSPVESPLDGTVHSFADNDIAFDYGPTIILQHQTEEGDVFFTLYGHLSRTSLLEIREGQSIGKGEEFAAIGSATENGGWPPHLHFQVMTHDLGLKGNYPGVVRARDLEVWKSLLLDPNWILKIPGECFSNGTNGAEEIAARRQACLNPSLSLSYEEPLHIVRGKAQYLYDANGVGYLDCVNNVCHVGHCHPRVVEAAATQLSVLNTNTRYLHDAIVSYAERLTAKLPGDLEICYFVNSGSEANDLALRLARNFTGRPEVICVEGAYHGNLGTLVEISPYKFDSPGGKGKPDSVHKVPLPDLYRGSHRGVDLEGSAGEYYAETVRRAIEKSAADFGEGGLGVNGEHQVAAFICESIMSCAGQIVLPEDYLEQVYQVAREKEIVCIADEVQVGFGRVGEKFWGFETQGVVPEIVTLGKPIGNGFPLGAVVTTREIAEAFNNGMEYFNTFGGNPVSCAVGNAVLDVIENQQLVENARHVGAYFLKALKQLQAEHRSIGDVRGKGLFLGIEFVVDSQRREPNPALANYIVERMKKMRVLLSCDGIHHNVVKIKPPIIFTQADVEQVISRLTKVLKEDFPSSFEG
ncbi:MAG: aminotransferase class III-fold pyridoxal phosphate-dependent enzyme, partial [Planctomycetota bacterium]|nr:aminotransferase class III-fold pyridoxal phosphate-dependent enzyme [Planctomycetota bacterium]